MGSPGFELESPVRGTSARGQEVTRAPQPCQEIPVEQTSAGALAEMRPDLSIGAALPAGRQRPGSGSPAACRTRAAWAKVWGWLVMTAGASSGGV